MKHNFVVIEDIVDFSKKQFDKIHRLFSIAKKKNKFIRFDDAYITVTHINIVDGCCHSCKINWKEIQVNGLIFNSGDFKTPHNYVAQITPSGLLCKCDSHYETVIKEYPKLFNLDGGPIELIFDGFVENTQYCVYHRYLFDGSFNLTDSCVDMKNYKILRSKKFKNNIQKNMFNDIIPIKYKQISKKDDYNEFDMIKELDELNSQTKCVRYLQNDYHSDIFVVDKKYTNIIVQKKLNDLYKIIGVSPTINKNLIKKLKTNCVLTKHELLDLINTIYII